MSVSPIGKRSRLPAKTKILCLALLACAMSLSLVSVAADNGSMGAVPIELSSNGDTYFINSKTDLSILRNDVRSDTHYEGKTVELTCDTNLNGDTIAAIGTYEKPFKGTFDGKGYTISNFKITATDNIVHMGLFGYIPEGGAVRNLNVASMKIEGTFTISSNVFAKAGCIAGQLNGTVSGCTASGAINLTCTNSGSNGGNLSAGGLAGHLDLKGIVENCSSNVNIDIKASKEVRAGGVAGCNNGTVTNCFNSGAVSSSSTAANSESFTGGLAGYNQGKVTNCSNSGTVSSSLTKANTKGSAGGVAGFTKEIIDNCSNSGTVSSSSTAANTKGSAGGIAGTADTGSTITNARNTAAVSSDGAYAAAGGIAGFLLTNSAVRNAYNTGSVTASATTAAASGGIAGGSESAFITNCVSQGTIPQSSRSGYSGGILGNYTVAPNITDCYWQGTLGYGCGGSIRSGAVNVSIVNGDASVGGESLVDKLNGWVLSNFNAGDSSAKYSLWTKGTDGNIPVLMSTLIKIGNGNAKSDYASVAIGGDSIKFIENPSAPAVYKVQQGSAAVKIADSEGRLIPGVTSFTDADGRWVYDRLGLNATSVALYSFSFAGSGGTLTAKVGGIDNPGPYEDGTSVEVAAIPDGNYAFHSWSDGGAQTHNVTADGNKTLTAYFQRVYSISASAGTGGTISPSGTVYALSGSGRTFSITPAEGNFIKDVLVDGVSVGAAASYTFSGIYGDCAISAEFVPAVTVTVLKEGGGSVSGAGKYKPGSSVTVSAVPDRGYLFASWSDGGAQIHSFTAESDVTLTAVFTPAPAGSFNIHVEAGTGGSYSGNTSVTRGAGTSIFIIPDSGYRISSVKLDGVEMGTSPAVNLVKVVSDHHISIEFSVLEGSKTEIGADGSVTSGAEYEDGQWHVKTKSSIKTDGSFSMTLKVSYEAQGTWAEFINVNGSKRFTAGGNIGMLQTAAQPMRLGASDDNKVYVINKDAAVGALAAMDKIRTAVPGDIVGTDPALIIDIVTGGTGSNRSAIRIDTDTMDRLCSAGCSFMIISSFSKTEFDKVSVKGFADSDTDVTIITRIVNPDDLSQTLRSALRGDLVQVSVFEDGIPITDLPGSMVLSVTVKAKEGQNPKDASVIAADEDGYRKEIRAAYSEEKSEVSVTVGRTAYFGAVLGGQDMNVSQDKTMLTIVGIILLIASASALAAIRLRRPCAIAK